MGLLIVATLSCTAVHIQDAGYCNAWVSSTPTASLPAFARAGAPPLDRAAATF